MADTFRRTSAMTQASRLTKAERDARPRSSDGPQKDIWSSLLDSVASGKRLPEKTLLVLGGSPEIQKDFLDSLSSNSPDGRRHSDRQSKRPPPLANQFALGYTYQDVLDADHEDILARVSVYLLSEPSSSFLTLLRPLLTNKTLENLLVVVLLDWSQPWSWVRQLRDWIRLLRTVLVSLDDDCKEVMEEVMIAWRDRKRGSGGVDAGESGVRPDGDVAIPLGPGEWEDALGVPLCVVCQNADKIESLEKEQGWKEEEFDFVLQFIRTILLKHGSSLIYTSTSSPNSLQALIHSSLGIQSMLKKASLKHNVIDRDKVLVPPNWDSWGKIRVLREGFDVEGVNAGWSFDIQGSLESADTPKDDPMDPEQPVTPAIEETSPDTALSRYETTIRDPHHERALTSKQAGPKIEVESLDTQEFLAEQLEVIERIKSEEEQEQAARKDAQRASMSSSPFDDGRSTDSRAGGSNESGRVNEHIGPVQFNVGGIQVDADDMLKRLKEREANRVQGEPSTPGASTATVSTPESKSQNEALASFFAGLMKRGGGGSAANSPR
ncbi:MAG: hypothetical protein M1833_001650 [Piccolia ochrophora]|nr:MAG: hypothetical protein M1833_001650 [Piccolia ochrophora]